MSQFSQPSYDVQRPSGFCLATGRSLQPGEACWSALIDIPEEEREPKDPVGMKRVDVSDDAWASGYRPPGLFSFWKTTVPDPRKKQRVFVDDTVLTDLVRRLEDTQEPRRQAFRYVVALILLRKKLLRFDGTRAEGDRDAWLLTPKADPAKGHLGKWDEGATLRVLDPKLDEQGISAVTEQLGEVLDTGVEA